MRLKIGEIKYLETVVRNQNYINIRVESIKFVEYVQLFSSQNFIFSLETRINLMNLQSRIWRQGLDLTVWRRPSWLFEPPLASGGESTWTMRYRYLKAGPENRKWHPNSPNLSSKTHLLPKWDKLLHREQYSLQTHNMLCHLNIRQLHHVTSYPKPD